MFNGEKKTEHSKYTIRKSTLATKISFDASSNRWGTIWNSNYTEGLFSLDKMDYNINVKELFAAKFSLKMFFMVSNAHVKLLSHNATTGHGINNMCSNKSFKSSRPDVILG